MNVRDSEVICGLLFKEGYGLTKDFRNADIIILNTCSVRKHAEDRVFSLIGEYAKVKGMPFKNSSKEKVLNGFPVIGIVGCMAKNYEEAIFKRAEEIDFAVGPQDIGKIPKVIKRLLSERASCQNSHLFERKVWETDGSDRSDKIYRTGFYEDKKHAYVVISEGCSNFCSYCIVPFVRGPIRNRKYKDILREVKKALENGITSFTLLGQNVNSYKDGKIDFIKLLELVDSLKGVKNINFMTSHPKDASVKLFKAISNLRRLGKSLHLPLQSGSERILKLMNRGYTVKDYLRLVSNYRKIVRGGKLSTDIIVGFPTESKEDFKDTMDIFKKISFDSAYIFKYSPRPKTAAFNMADTVEKKEKEKRHALMLNLCKKMILALVFVAFFSNISLALNIDKVKINFLSGNYAEVIREAEAIIAKGHYSSELYYFLGLSYLKRGEFIKARESFKVVVGNFKDTRFKEESRIGMADTYLLSADTSNAKNIYKSILADNPATKYKGEIDQRLNNIPDLEASGVYSVQVGSFANKDNARNLSYKLNSYGYPAYIEEGGLPNKSYKVRVGRLTSLEEAKVLERRLSKEGYPTKICP